MKIAFHKNRRAGFSYLTILIPVVLIGAALASYLRLVNGSNYASARSQSWNISVVIAESGVEEALAHLNSASTNNLGVNGWNKSGNTLFKRSTIRPGYYYEVTVDVTDLLNPIINSRGFVPAVINNAR
jgi:Tfp pilus assembly protein PilV